jgi:uncharacterized membrane protein
MAVAVTVFIFLSFIADFLLVDLALIIVCLFVCLFGDGGAEAECTKDSLTYKVVIEMIIRLLLLK